MSGKTDTWDPALYTRFEAERTRPARDLVAQVPLASAARVADLGCGPGNSTELLVARFPAAAVTGIDTSAAMLAQAKARLPGCRFAEADIALWEPDAPQDLIYANAALQWVPDHTALIPRLLGFLAPGGVLAVQVPDNRNEPSHRLMREVAAAGAWAERLAPAAARLGVLPANTYYDMLAGGGATVELWRTVFYHRMDGAGAIVDWVRGTGLQPFLAPLDETERAAYLAQYEASVDRAYGVRADGKRLLLFPRLFFVAQRPA